MSSIPARPATILIVDDDDQIGRALTSILHARGYRLSLVTSVHDALERAIDEHPDLVILDMLLPDGSGIDVCHSLRSWSNVPILMLSVCNSAADKIRAFAEGADDYLTKPFSAGELVARVGALLRRVVALASPRPVTTVGDLLVDSARRRVRLSGEDVPLTPTEFDILACLARNADVVVTHQQIITEVWAGGSAEDAQALRVHISHLRKKIELAHGRRYILTEPGVGFRLCDLLKESA